MGWDTKKQKEKENKREWDQKEWIDELPYTEKVKSGTSPTFF